ncbi:MAG TPA: FAD-dependent oxidoreductase, partial [Ktedonobacteraceae bacterium]
INYDRLLLANGARPRQLSCAGLNLAGVSTLRSVADYQEILRRLSHVNRVVISGSGTLALESAETLRQRGYEVTHLLRGSTGATLWSEVLDAVASDMVLQEERRDGIDVRTGEEIAEIVGKHGQVAQVITTSGERIGCELVLIAIGIEPLLDFIRASGIACGRGVKVDNGMRTNVADIYAAGDVIETSDASTGRTRVLGQWFPAIQQAQVAAYNMLGLLSPGHPFYPGSPIEARAAYTNYYNATFLYGLDFVGIGLTTHTSKQVGTRDGASHANRGYQEIIADPQPRNYRKVVLKGGVIVGALLLGDRTDAMAFKRAIDHGVSLAPVARQLFTAGFDLDAWLDQHNVPGAILQVGKEIQSCQDASASTEIGRTARRKEDSGEYRSGKDRLVDTPALSTTEYTRNMLAKDVDAILAPIPHPKVHISVAEMQLNQSDQPAVFSIGRQNGVSLQLEHSSVSRLHALVNCADGGYVLRDNDSANGTFVNGLQLARSAFHQLRHHDRVRFGDVQFRFEVRLRASSPHPSPSGGASPRPYEYIPVNGGSTENVPDAILRTLGDRPMLVVVGQKAVAGVIPLAYERRYTVGRDAQNDIVLDDSSASRRHAEIFSAPDGFYVRDLDS